MPRRTPKSAQVENENDIPLDTSGGRKSSRQSKRKSNVSSAALTPVTTVDTGRSRRSSTAAQTAASVADFHSGRGRRSSVSSDSNARSRDASVEGPRSRAHTRRAVKEVNYVESDGDEEVAKPEVLPEEEYNAEEDIESDSGDSTKGKKKLQAVATPTSSRRKVVNSRSPRSTKGSANRGRRSKGKKDQVDTPKLRTPNRRGRYSKTVTDEENEEEDTTMVSESAATPKRSPRTTSRKRAKYTEPATDEDSDDEKLDENDSSGEQSLKNVGKAEVSIGNKTKVVELSKTTRASRAAKRNDEVKSVDSGLSQNTQRAQRGRRKASLVTEEVTDSVPVDDESTRKRKTKESLNNVNSKRLKVSNEPRSEAPENNTDNSNKSLAEISDDKSEEPMLIDEPQKEKSPIEEKPSDMEIDGNSENTSDINAKKDKLAVPEEIVYTVSGNDQKELKPNDSNIIKPSECVGEITNKDVQGSCNLKESLENNNNESLTSKDASTESQDSLTGISQENISTGTLSKDKDKLSLNIEQLDSVKKELVRGNEKVVISTDVIPNKKDEIFTPIIKCVPHEKKDNTSIVDERDNNLIVDKDNALSIDEKDKTLAVDKKNEKDNLTVIEKDGTHVQKDENLPKDKNSTLLMEKKETSLTPDSKRVSHSSLQKTESNPSHGNRDSFSSNDSRDSYSTHNKKDDYSKDKRDSHDKKETHEKRDSHDKRHSHDKRDSYSSRDKRDSQSSRDKRDSYCYDKRDSYSHDKRDSYSSHGDKRDSYSSHGKRDSYSSYDKRDSYSSHDKRDSHGKRESYSHDKKDKYSSDKRDSCSPSNKSNSHSSHDKRDTTEKRDAARSTPEKRDAVLPPVKRDAVLTPEKRETVLTPEKRETILTPEKRDPVLTSEKRDAVLTPDKRDVGLIAEKKYAVPEKSYVKPTAETRDVKISPEKIDARFAQETKESELDKGTHLVNAAYLTSDSKTPFDKKDVILKPDKGAITLSKVPVTPIQGLEVKNPKFPLTSEIKSGENKNLKSANEVERKEFPSNQIAADCAKIREIYVSGLSEIHSSPEFHNIFHGRKYIVNQNISDELWVNYCNRTVGVVSYNLGGEAPKPLENFVASIKLLKSELVCMQGVNGMFHRGYLEATMDGLGYKGLFVLPEDCTVGFSLFFKSTIIKLKTHCVVSLKQAISKELESSLTDVHKVVLQQIPVCGTVLLANFQLSLPDNQVHNFVLANVNIPQSDLSSHALQMSCLARETLNFMENPLHPLIICGAFNMVSSEASYQLLKDGYLSDEMIDTLQSKKDIKVPGKENTALVDLLWKSFQHSAAGLKSCYSTVLGQEVPMPSSSEMIWYSSSALHTLSILDVLADSKSQENSLSFNKHVMLKANLAFAK